MFSIDEKEKGRKRISLPKSLYDNADNFTLLSSLIFLSENTALIELVTAEYHYGISRENTNYLFSGLIFELETKTPIKGFLEFDKNDRPTAQMRAY